MNMTVCTLILVLIHIFWLYKHLVRNEEISEAHMFLMLPTGKGKGAFEEVERKLPGLNFEEIFEKMEVVFGDVLLPKMEMDFTTNLGPFLSAIGQLHSIIILYSS